MFNNDFFPTPAGIVYKMLAKVSNNARYFLEPSAGKGNIAEAIKSKFGRGVDIDCIEHDQELLGILESKDFTIVGYDFLEYNGVSYYDTIVMNPPFSNGDEHLLKAWNFLHAGEIVCLLNEETIKNPYSATRKLLASIIETHGDVEFLGDCFSTAARKTGVNVVMVYLTKKAVDDTADLWSKSSEEKNHNINLEERAGQLALIDNLGNMQHFYDMANEQMFKAIEHIRKAAVYLGANGLYTSHFEKTLNLALTNSNTARAEFSKLHRKEVWKEALSKADFNKWLDRRQQSKFAEDIARGANIPFTKDNIKGTLENIFLKRGEMFNQSVANIFDDLTRYFNGNTSYTEGWKTNDSYKVNKKIVYPRGCSYDSKYNTFQSLYYSHYDIYDDLDRILSVLDGKDFLQCGTVKHALNMAFELMRGRSGNNFNNTTESQYFYIKFFKKGTVHLVFKDAHLWEKFNIAASKGKMWLGQQTQKEAA